MSALTPDRIASVIAPLARITQPKLYGVEHIPERGVLELQQDRSPVCACGSLMGSPE